MFELSHFQSSVYYVLTNEAWFVARVRKWRRTPSPSPPLICCFKIVIRWCCALQTIRTLAFLFSSKLKDASRSWNLPQAIFIETNGAIKAIYTRENKTRLIFSRINGPIISLIVIRCTFVIRALLKFAR